jgi:hypothetical protein
MIKILKFYGGIKYTVIGLSCLWIAFFLFSLLLNTAFEHEIKQSLEALPNYNYISDIKTFKEEGRLSEALEISRFVIRNPDMPGQVEAEALENEIEGELTALWGKTQRAIKGFVLGTGNSVEEIVGAMTSDIIVYGDIRDLIKQGYYKATGKETDPLIATFAGVGLLTEVVDAVDWAPAVVKAFHKIEAISQSFAEFLINSAKKSLKEKRLDGALKSVFENFGQLIEKMGLARTANVLKHIHNDEELQIITNIARKNVDALYFTVKNGGDDALIIIKKLGDSDFAVKSMEQAAKKGPSGFECLKKVSEGRKYLFVTRYSARISKHFRIGNIQSLLEEHAMKNAGARKIVWICAALIFCGACISFIKASIKFYAIKKHV